MATREPKGWITVNGVHVPIFEGESKADAAKNYLNKRKSEPAKKTNREHFEDAKREGRIPKDSEYEDFIDYSPMTEEKAKRAVERGTKEDIKNEQAAEEKKQTKAQKTIAANEDLKEKQIARNKAEKEEANKQSAFRENTAQSRNALRQEIIKAKKEELPYPRTPQMLKDKREKIAALESKLEKMESDAKKGTTGGSAGNKQKEISKSGMNKLQEIAERYTTSSPVSGNWDTEAIHMRDTIVKEMKVTPFQATQLMKNKLGFSDKDFIIKGGKQKK